MTQPTSLLPHPYRTAPVPPAIAAGVIPYAGETRMRLAIAGGIADARVRIDPDADALIRVDAGAPAPRLERTHGQLRLTWPRSFRDWFRAVIAGEPRDVEIVLHPEVAWELEVRGGASDVALDLAAGHVSRLAITGGCSGVELALPRPDRDVPIRIAGGATEVRVRRPADVGVALTIGGGASWLRLDEQAFEAIGGPMHLTAGVAPDAPRYDLHVGGGASGVEVTASADRTDRAP